MPKLPTLPKPKIPGLAKGLAVTMKTMLRRSVTAQYPHVKPDLPPRSRMVIALMDENCTVCMFCSRECPDWCIYIDSHKEVVPPKTEGGRARTRNVLDRFAIDFALCMYCGICIDVCPFDALFWSPEFEYSTYTLAELTHEQPRLREWMDTVPLPEALESGAQPPAEIASALAKAQAQRAASLPAPGAAATTTAEAAAPASAAATTTAPPREAEIEVEAGEIDQETYDALIAEGKSERVARARAKATYVRKRKAELRAQMPAAEGADEPAPTPAAVPTEPSTDPADPATPEPQVAKPVDPDEETPEPGVSPPADDKAAGDQGDASP